MKSFWNYHGWEGLLCLLSSVPLVLSFSQGFYIPDRVADSVPIAALVCAATLLYCFLGSYDRVTILCFSLGFAAIAAVFFLWMRHAGIDIVDAEGSATAVYIYYIAAPLIAAITFLLSRSRLGIVALLLIGSCLHAVLVFLHFEIQAWYVALFVLGTVALFLLRQYRVNALRSSTVTPKFGRYFGVSAAVGLAGLLLALGFWAAVIRPLAPPVLDLKLLTKYMSYDILDMVGIAKQYPIPDDLFTDTRETEQDLSVNDQDTETEEGPPVEQDPLETDSGESLPDTGANDTPLPLDSVSYDRDLTGWLAAVIILIVLLLVSVPFVRKYLRRRRLSKLTRGEPREQVIGLYRFYLKKFSRIGCPRAPAQTEQEYAAQYETRLTPFLEGGLSLGHMTGLYLDARYGGLPVSEEDCAAFAEVYMIFLRNYRSLTGPIRYLIKFFVL